MDASSNSTLQEVTATGLDQVVNVGEALPEILAERDAGKDGKHDEPVVATRPHPAGQSRPFAGFDGVGGSDQQYASAQVSLLDCAIQCSRHWSGLSRNATQNDLLSMISVVAVAGTVLI